MTHWMRPHELEQQHARDAFDPIAEGARYRLSPEVSLVIWDRVRATATDAAGRLDLQQARLQFHELATRLAARGGRLRPDIGRLTRVGVELDGGSLDRWRVDEIAPRTPGRATLVIAEAKRWEATAGAFAAPGDHAGAEAEDSVLPGAREVAKAMAAMGMTSAAPAGRRAAEQGPVGLPTAMRDRMEQAFGHRLDDVELHVASAEVLSGHQAFTRAQQIHLGRGVDLESPRGEFVVAHELAHVVQQRGGGERPGTPDQLEREAQRAALLASRGQPARIALRANPAAAYAFSEDEHSDHDDAANDAADASAETHSNDASHTDASHDAEDDAQVAQAADRRDDQANPGGGAKPDPASQPADETAAQDHDADDAGPATTATALDLGVIPAEDSAAGAPGGGGAAAAKPQKEPPNVAGAKPEAGLGQLRGVRPDKLGPVLGQVHTAAGADVARERAKQQANPPKQMSTGAAGAQGGKARDGAPAADAAPTDKSAGAKAAVDRKVKGEVPGGEAAKKAQQAQAQNQQNAAGQAVTQAAQSNRSWFSSLWPGSGASGDANAAKMSDAESQKMAGSVGNLSTKADVSTDAGPAPELAMKSEAKGSADKDRASLETKTAALESQGRADAGVPMGEAHIETTVAAEELSAKPVAAGGAGPAAELPTLAGAASSEEAGIVAQEQSGAEIDAALSKASADVTAERGKHAAEEAQAQANSDRQINELKTASESEQAAARTAAQAEVQASRAQWKSEIDTKGADARKQADKKVSEGMTQVEAEETKANAEAKQHVEDGKRKAEDEKQKGEKEAEDAKSKGKEKSSGFFGWLADKAKAAFDGIKKAVSAAIDACKRAVKAVIDAAKKLAMAAIELARKAITAAIKAIGDALIAISNVLLAAFPGLKAKFQAAIRKAVDKAVNAVNKLADALKKGVQKALDMLGAAIDKALSLLEKGINAIIDAANAVVQGAIKAAQAVVEALGTWAKLLKDVASGPGAWIGKLGAAVIDGIKNHLWTAFKTAVVEWFKSKVFELLGIGGIILELLLEGGLTRENIIQMALDALMVAIPAALVAILVEKLVSMIVPAAGALMAIIEGLQAAWGTISRIIAAFAAFMAFLLAVKGGGAGALFAAVLASAAVVLLDFVASWLLKKLASAARKVGAKLKGLAEKFKSKRKAKKDAKAAKKHKDDHDGSGGKKKDHDDHDVPDGKKKTDKDDDNHAKSEKDKKKKEEQDKKNQEILAKAQRELPPKINAALAKRPGMLSFKARLLLWKTQYRLTSLTIKGPGGQHFRIQAKVNPEVELEGGYKFESDELLRILKEVAHELWDKHFRTRAMKGKTDAETAQQNREHSRADLERMQADGSARDARGGDTGTSRVYAPTKPADDLRLAAAAKTRTTQDVHHGSPTADGSLTAQTRQQAGGGRFTEIVDPKDNSTSSGLDYDEIVSRLKDAGHGPEDIGDALRLMQTGKGIPGEFAGQAKELSLLRNLMFNVEVQRDRRNMIFSAMSQDAMSNGTDPEKILARATGQGTHPATPTGASVGFTDDGKVVNKRAFAIAGGESGVAALREENRRRQLETLQMWFRTQKLAGGVPVALDLAGLKKMVYDWVEQYYQLHPPG